MKIVSKKLNPDGSRAIKMVPEEEEDLWVLYNLIEIGDSVLAFTTRKVIRETSSGKTEPKRMGLELQIKVEDVEYYKQDSALRVRGMNILENEHVEIGAYHNLEIRLSKPVLLGKEKWDSFQLQALHHASDPTGNADLAVVLMQEGLAEIFLLGKSVTKSCSRISTSIPRKHGLAMGAYEKALNKFFIDVIDAFVKHIDFKVVRCAVIASPGFTKDQFHSQLLLEAERKNIRLIIENKSRIILAHTTSGYKHSLREVLEAPNIMKMIKGTKTATEVQALQDFYTMLSKDHDRACYGPKQVELANEQKAIQTLLITDEVYRNSDILTRYKYENLVKSVKGLGGTVHIFSSMNSSGEQLAMMTGIAAILRFPVPDLDDIDDH